jgi:UDP-N-acetylglucosamine 2-epimerase (non-hydrolysing)
MWTMPPASYLDFLGLIEGAAMVITDSGGIQEETTFLGVPCLTYRDNTERPVTIRQGTNRLAGTKPGNLVREARNLLGRLRDAGNRAAQPTPPPLWDGKAATRVVPVLEKFLESRGNQDNVQG